MAMRRTPIVGLLVLVVAAVGCKRLRTGAREDFGRIYSCPEERVEVRPRDELKYGDIVLGGAPKKTPPPEVSKDPGRLAKWERDRQEEDARSRARLNELEVFEVEGCDHVALLGCRHPEGEAGVLIHEVTCSEIPPNRIPK